MYKAKVGEVVVLEHPQVNEGEPLEVEVVGRAGGHFKVMADGVLPPRWVSSQCVHEIIEGESE